MISHVSRALDSQDRTVSMFPRQDTQDRTCRTEQIGQWEHDNKYGTGEQKSWDKNAGAEQLGKESLDRTAGKGQLEMTAGMVQRGQDGQYMKGQSSWDRSTEIGQLWQDSHDNKVGAWHLRHDIGNDTRHDSQDMSAWQVSLDRSAKTGQRGRDAWTRQQRLDCGDRRAVYKSN